MKKLIAIGASLAVVACASSPDRIQPAYVSPLQFQSLSCGQIDAEVIAVDARARDLHRRLDRRADNDAWEMGIGLVLFWPALLFLSGGDGHAAAEYSQLKGRRDALLIARQNCAAQTTEAAAAEIPGTFTLPGGGVRLVPAATTSGYCIAAPAGYHGTGSRSRPTVTSAMPRCQEVTGR